MLKIVSRSARETQRLGKRLGELSQAGDIFLLVGDLGSGKTCLTQGIALGLGVTENVFSPSFVLIREYRGRLRLYHIDFYRLNSVEEIADLGLEDYLYGGGVCVIEWAEKGMAVLPGENLLITLEYLSEKERSLTFEARGERYADLVRALEPLCRGKRVA
jgi:tRNA threonylcarbamoyladenosine biosynthesis protein TsaE